ncbi:LysR family transcriptional regulator [Salipiger sp.]|uniref:LysR family transcriptional regulator n=1 Tax=Salipiger sp. TaxID=2078585 RepID=UPI003A96DA79
MNNRISWDDQRLFLAVLDEGSLSGAARRLGLSHPTVRARIDALEAALGTVLFTRSARGLAPTDVALALRDSARRMALASEEFLRQASAPAGEAAGRVRLSVPEFMGVEVVPAMLRPLRDSHPGLVVELALSNARADLLGREVDLAVRTVAPEQEALVARRVAEIPLGFFAARDYLARRGRPGSVADLAAHDLIGPDRSLPDLEVAARLAPDLGPARFVLRTDSHPAQIAAARAGIGIAVIQVPAGERDPVLSRVLPEVTVARLGVWIVTHGDLRRVPRVRAVFDALVAGYSGV